jgi:hypothetical protein
VRVTPHHLADQLLEQVGHRELGQLLGEPRVEDHLKEQIPEFLAQVRAPTGLDRLQDFISFFDQVGLEGRSRLLTIPGAAVWSTQAHHDVKEPFEENAGGIGHVRS